MKGTLGAWLLASLALGCGGVTNPGGAGGDGVVPDCDARVDGVTTADELPLREGLSATHVRNAPGTQVSFDPEGSSDADGDGALWDLSAGPEDAGGSVIVGAAGAAWWAAAVPGATHNAILAPERPELRTLVSSDADGLWIHGLASADEAPAASRTLLVYDAPVQSLRWPLSLGEAWGQRATFRDATLWGLPNAGVEDWSFSVVAEGEAILPGGTRVRDVLAVRSEVHRRWAAAADLPENEETRYGLSLFGPCVGELARVGGTDPALVEVDELRRLRP